MIFIKHLEKILSVFGRYLISMNILPSCERRGKLCLLFYDLQVGAKLFLLIVVRSVALIRSRYVKEPYPTHLVIYT